jgi:hypothetical protein
MVRRVSTRIGNGGASERRSSSGSYPRLKKAKRPSQRGADAKSAGIRIPCSCLLWVDDVRLLACEGLSRRVLSPSQCWLAVAKAVRAVLRWVGCLNRAISKKKIDLDFDVNRKQVVSERQTSRGFLSCTALRVREQASWLGGRESPRPVKQS